MKRAVSGEERRKAYSPKVQAKSDTSTNCSFCWFVLNVYPTLRGMAPLDDAMYREHLKGAHGLTQEIQP